MSFAQGRLPFDFVQFHEVHECGNHFVLEADPRFAESVAAIKKELLQVLNAVSVTPERGDGFGNALMVLGDDRHLRLYMDLPWQLVTRHVLCREKFSMLLKLWKTKGFFCCHD